MAHRYNHISSRVAIVVRRYVRAISGGFCDYNKDLREVITPEVGGIVVSSQVKLACSAVKVSLWH